MSEFMNLSRPIFEFRTEPTKTISNGLAVSQNAILKIDKCVSSTFVEWLNNYMHRGLITIHTVSIVEIPIPCEDYWGA